MKKIFTFCILLLFFSLSLNAQGYISGDLELRNDYYVKDTAIGASGTNHYDDLKSSADSWLTLNYTNNDWGFRTGIRLDMFLNSRFHNPNNDAYTAFGVGRWFIEKDFKKMTLTGGHFYDQFGSGIAFRAYENRFLGIDNAIFGVKAKYQLNDNWFVKGFVGVRKNRLSFYKPIIKGLNIEGYIPIGDKLTLSPGIGVLNRTMDEESMSVVANAINASPLETRFVPKYNTYVFTAYNRLNAGNWTWFIEGAYKTHEAINVALGQAYQDKAGSVIYTSLTYSKKGFGITGQFKRTDNFQFRTSPEDNQTLIKGAINFIPPINRQNSLRLPARYQPASQEIQETALSLDFTYTPIKGKTFNFSFSEIHKNDINLKTYALDNLFRELYLDFEWKISKKLKTLQGFQFVQYNQDFYEGPAALPVDVQVYSPFFELSYKIDNKKSIRAELQYQSAKRDFGQWLYALVEFNIAPKFSVSVSDMWNFKPGPNKSSKNEHYYSVYTSYTQDQHRFFVSYVRQVEGIVCTGGICRLEPAFNGVRAGINTSF
ncbi:MAG: hypothetical protein H6579_05405 [Chitinophagales bacterium]|nr:hypothetical protein [Chitinophagales bacterium]